MEQPLVILFDGSVDCLLAQLLKQHVKSEVANRANWYQKLKSRSKLQTLRDELHLQNQMQAELRKEYDQLHPEYLQVLDIEKACETIQKKIQNVTDENRKLENDVAKMRMRISQKESYVKLNSALDKTMKPLLAKNKALKKEKEAVTKKYDKINQEAYKCQEKERQRNLLLEENKDLLELMRTIKGKAWDLEITKTVSSKVSDLKKQQSTLLEEARHLNWQRVRIEKVDLYMLKLEKRAYSDLNKALEKEKKALEKEVSTQERQNEKLRKKRQEMELLQNKNAELQEQVEKMHGSLQKGGILKQSLASELSLHEVSKIQKSLRSDVATQTTTVTNLKKPEAEASTQTFMEEAGSRSEIVMEKSDVGIQVEEEFETQTHCHFCLLNRRNLRHKFK